MQVMLLFYAKAYTGTGAAPSAEEFGTIVEAHLTYERDVLRTKAEVIVGQALQPAVAARTVRFPGSGGAIEPGPAVATEEALGGFYLIDCPDLDQAADLAALYPMPPEFGCIEVRPVIPFDPELRRRVVGVE